MALPITCIVTNLPPAIDGVGDYSLNLARQLCQNFGIETDFIIGNPNWAGSENIEDFPVSKVTDRSVNSLLSLLSKSQANQKCATILLHYVCYGYDFRGCPVWLVDGLQRWKQASSDRTLITMFHETYASGPPWTSTFWVSPLQKHLLARLARLSDRCITSREGYAQVLSKLSLGKHTAIPSLPVFSNIGETEQVPLLAERRRRLVVFGGASRRQMVYQRSLAALEQTCQELEIEEILDIGPPINLEISQIGGLPLVALGKRPTSEISQILSNSLAGFFDYHTEYLAKSTIYAAYSAHRMIPVGIFYTTAPADGLAAGKHYWLADRAEEKLSLTIGQAIADNAYTWYQTHSLSSQAKVFAAQLIGN